MTKQRNQPRRWRALCADLRPDDGVDPKRDEVHPPRDAAADRRLGRLCGEVRHALRLALAACGDPDLQALEVYAVEPAPMARAWVCAT